MPRRKTALRSNLLALLVNVIHNTIMKRLFAALPMLLAAAPAVAQNVIDGRNDGAVALAMTTQLYCGLTKVVIGGNIGLFIGFAIALYGLYVLVQSASMRGVYIIVVGAMLTALPGLVVTGLKGANLMLGTLSTRQITTPNC
jgi:hypothetical protein